jgi:hypothetical protein
MNNLVGGSNTKEKNFRIGIIEDIEKGINTIYPPHKEPPIKACKKETGEFLKHSLSRKLPKDRKDNDHLDGYFDKTFQKNRINHPLERGSKHIIVISH